MTKTKLFITGATGFIGGSVLNKLVVTHPELQITALLRSPSSEFADKYPDVIVIKGTFDDSDTIESAARESDIVLHCGDTDHVTSVEAILAGLQSRKEKSYLIHLTGTGCISDVAEEEWLGKTNPHIWNDVDGIDEIYNLPEKAMHRTVDKWIQDASNETLKTVCVCPPDIYGQSRGIGNRATFMVPNYVEALFQFQEAFYLGEGQNYRAVTHINDVVDIFILLIEQALQGGGNASWGREGFYFAVSDEVKWKDAAVAINKLAQENGWLPRGTETVSWDKKTLLSNFPDAPERAQYIWGSNSRAKSARAAQLGWTPRGPSFWAALAEDVSIAAKNHAK
ncbi:NAD(P)-binding protein [Microthyrium microscopicum]|uniref:NAD(P)-binding protein n=1 Tax=Microthyrium microscopicum TaxID=703497 RepID=A0A6A6UN19_9PEZI|nr:NAD(P)-binding protein [Microthyrium microscopicum]